jgi:hypothetical protein
MADSAGFLPALGCAAALAPGPRAAGSVGLRRKVRAARRGWHCRAGRPCRRRAEANCDRAASRLAAPARSSQASVLSLCRALPRESGGPIAGLIDQAPADCGVACRASRSMSPTSARLPRCGHAVLRVRCSAACAAQGAGPAVGRGPTQVADTRRRDRLGGRDISPLRGQLCYACATQIKRTCPSKLDRPP